ncbi:zinc-binding dehydrogenase [Actinoallomurus vinaceus]|uniref:zinc-binding dehydrogenase n=1 Tax=Actinoallomurus vinaceus TaxID=1080074 RepID=UPI003CD06A89
MRPALFSERCSRCVRTEQCFVQATVTHLPFGEAALFEEGRFRLPLQEVFSMAQAARAHASAAQGPRQGKIALTVPISCR